MVAEMGELGNVGMKKDTVPKSVNKRTLPENCKGASRKGIPNKVTKQLKEMILGALDDAGGQEYLARQAEENPGAFLALIGKVLPTTLAGEITQNVTVVAKTPEQVDQALLGILGADWPKA